MPLMAVNHLEAHALTVGLTEGLLPPYLLLLVSGGHTQLLVVRRRRPLSAARHHHRRCAGRGLRQDRQAARPRLSRRPGRRAGRAHRASRERFALPRPMLGRRRAAFLLRRPQDRRPAPGAGAGPAAASRTSPTCARPSRRPSPTAWSDRVRARHASSPTRGSAPRGTAPRGRRRRRRQPAPARGAARLPPSAGFALHVPPPALCTRQRRHDRLGRRRAARARARTDGLDIAARARWPLDPDATPALGFGRLGAKA